MSGACSVKCFVWLIRLKKRYVSAVRFYFMHAIKPTSSVFKLFLRGVLSTLWSC